MIYRRLGRTGLQVSLMTLGSGGPNQFGQKAGVPEAEIHRLVHQALDLGINFFDTSPGYAESELILGRALRHVPRQRFVISTKVALDDGNAGDNAAPPKKVVETVEASLRRLGVDAIDVLLVGGWPKPAAYEKIMTETWPLVQNLRRDGKVRFISASEKSAFDGSHTWLARGLREDLFDSIMVAYNMINQSAEREVFPLCQANDVGVQSIFAVRSLFNHPERLAQVLTELHCKSVVPSGLVPGEGPLDWLVRGDVGSVVEAAYRFCVGHPAVSTVVTGTISPAHLAENVATVLRGPLPEADMARLRQLFGCVAEVVGN